MNAVIENVPAYRGFRTVELTWETFRDAWLPGLERAGLLVGVNWIGLSVVGYDVTPRDVIRRVEGEIEQLNSN